MLVRVVLVAVAAAGHACDTPAPLTELIVEVRTSLAVPGEIDAARIVVTAPNGESFTAEGPFTSGARPLTLGVQHVGGPLGPLSARATGLRGGAAVVTQVVDSSFLEGQSRVLDLLLEARCIGMSCGERMSCFAGRCDATVRPPDTLRRVDPSDGGP